MNKIYKGHIIEFNSLSDNRKILIDGHEFSMDATLNKYGFSWRTSANGIIFCYSSVNNIKIDNGFIFEIPRKKMINWSKEEEE